MYMYYVHVHVHVLYVPLIACAFTFHDVSSVSVASDLMTSSSININDSATYSSSCEHTYKL